MLQATVETRVRFAETDAMGVTYHGNYLPWFEMARVALLDQLGTPYRELEQQGFLLPVLETGLTYQVERDGELLVEGFTVHAFVNREFKAVRPPDHVEAAMRQAFGA